jgi:hypothetical protein
MTNSPAVVECSLSEDEASSVGVAAGQGVSEGTWDGNPACDLSERAANAPDVRDPFANAAVLRRVRDQVYR